MADATGFRIDVFHHASGEEQILSQLMAMQGRLTEILQQGGATMVTIQDIQNDMTAETTLIEGLGTLISGLKQQVADALATVTIPVATQAQIDALFATAEANKAALTAALTVGTVAAPVVANPVPAVLVDPTVPAVDPNAPIA